MVNGKEDGRRQGGGNLLVHLRVLVQAGVALAAVEAAGQRGRQLADEAVVRDAEVAELEGEADEVGDEVWRVDAAVDEDGAVDVGVVGGGIDGGLGPLSSETDL